jgi:hypothetical protein
MGKKFGSFTVAIFEEIQNKTASAISICLEAFVIAGSGLKEMLQRQDGCIYDGFKIFSYTVNK